MSGSVAKGFEIQPQRTLRNTEYQYAAASVSLCSSVSSVVIAVARLRMAASVQRRPYAQTLSSQGFAESSAWEPARDAEYSSEADRFRRDMTVYVSRLLGCTWNQSLTAKMGHSTVMLYESGR